jgi:hypothetical protein
MPETLSKAAQALVNDCLACLLLRLYPSARFDA